MQRFVETLVTALFLSGLSLTASAQDTRPNILLVLFDDVGFMDLGAYGGEARTPTIDAQRKILGSVCHGALGLVSAKGTDGELLVKGRRVTGVTNNQINTFGIAITPKHPEDELKRAGAIFEAQHAWRDPFATHTTIDGNLITGQNQNSGYETSHRILEKLATQSNL